MIELRMHLFETYSPIVLVKFHPFCFIYTLKCSTITADSVEDYSDVIIVNMNRKNIEPMKL